MALTTSQAYDYAPSTGELILQAFARLQIRRADVTAEQMLDGRHEANLWLVTAANLGPNLWTVDLQTVPLVAGQATYSVPAETVMMLDVFIKSSAGGTPTDRTIQSISRTDYANIPNKEQQGSSTSFWFDRTISPTVTLWPVPSGAATESLCYYRFRQVQDAATSGGQNVELPYRFLDAFVAGLSHRLARIYAPALEGARKADAVEAWQIATTQDVENVPLSIAPGLGVYYR